MNDRPVVLVFGSCTAAGTGTSSLTLRMYTVLAAAAVLSDDMN